MTSWWTGGCAEAGATGAQQQGQQYEGPHGARSHYQVLGLKADADAAAIRAAYQREVLRCHPDKQQARQEQETDGGGGGGDGDGDALRVRFAAVQAAYAALREPEARAAYDAQLARRAQMEEATRIAPAEELDLSEMDVEEEEEEEEEEQEEQQQEREGAPGPPPPPPDEEPTAAAAAAKGPADTLRRRRRREGVATYPCRCGDLYRLPMRAAREAAARADAAAAADADADCAAAPAPPPPSLLVQCRGCSNHALVRV